jgi:hypothetical protein
MNKHKHPNVILAVTDDKRCAWLARTGETVIAAPKLDSFARRCTALTILPSRRSGRQRNGLLMTSRSPLRNVACHLLLCGPRGRGGWPGSPVWRCR